MALAKTRLGEAEGVSPALITVFAGFITIGDYGSVERALALVRQEASKTTPEDLDTDGYDISYSRYLDATGDADNDGYSNVEEWVLLARAGNKSGLPSCTEVALDGQYPRSPDGTPNIAYVQGRSEGEKEVQDEGAEEVDCTSCKSIEAAVLRNPDTAKAVSILGHCPLDVLVECAQSSRRFRQGWYNLLVALNAEKCPGFRDLVLERIKTDSDYLWRAFLPVTHDRLVQLNLPLCELIVDEKSSVNTRIVSMHFLSRYPDPEKICPSMLSLATSFYKLPGTDAYIRSKAAAVVFKMRPVDEAIKILSPENNEEWEASMMAAPISNKREQSYEAALAVRRFALSCMVADVEQDTKESALGVLLETVGDWENTDPEQLERNLRLVEDMRRTIERLADSPTRKALLYIVNGFDKSGRSVFPRPSNQN